MGKGDQISQPAGMLLLTLKFLGCKQAISQLGDCTNMSENILYDIIVKTFVIMSFVFCIVVLGGQDLLMIQQCFLDCDLYSDASKNVDTYFPNGAYLVGDESFPLTDWLIKPFDEDNTLTVSQQHFNTACQEVMKHSTAAYTLLLQRFPRLDYVDVRDMQTMVVVILVCCALHNFCLDCGDKQPFSDAVVTVRNINTPPASGMPKRTALGEERQQILQKLFILHS
ncbi:putative nuclease HARBI1 [Pomacea canaliculata]|uniref:putative nuclease HARBI1 n=1 Tax=Pomacea canaliculata TaxID=400727 RepID=UPI000D72A5AF|nr:putative nuclease HARBI1 [Pomacea canaliculata]